MTNDEHTQQNSKQDSQFWFNDSFIFQCQFCCSFASRSSRKSLQHLRDVHGVGIWNLSRVLPFLDVYLEEKMRLEFGGGECVRYKGDMDGEVVWGSPFELAAATTAIEESCTNSNASLEDLAASDQELRETCQTKRLLQVLQVQEQEIKSLSSPVACLFCKKFTPTASTSLLFSHLHDVHSLIIGSPYSLVSIEQFLSILHEKVSERKECIFCERAFPDHITLRKHMRKKKHFRINPKNRDYDCFYVKNYYATRGGGNGNSGSGRKSSLDLSQTDLQDNHHQVQEQVQANNEAPQTAQPNPQLEEEDEEEEGGDYEDWTEVVPMQPTQCLFDDTLLPSPLSCHEHMKRKHGFDLSLLDDFYDRIRAVNYLRWAWMRGHCIACARHRKDGGEVVMEIEEEDGEKLIGIVGDLGEHYEQVHGGLVRIETLFPNAVSLAKSSVPSVHINVNSTDVVSADNSSQSIHYAGVEMWSNPSLLFPFVEGDPLLMLDLEEEEDDDLDQDD